ncbi:MAG TPA: Holliday junction branch migration protein RuvA, partial [Dehalococcoidia bacterium]|nr:Holliday junction branch migration protein RuvA [Dehalococcoidia bacterium]
MIDYVRGQLAERRDNWAVVDVAGVGYAVLLPAFVAATLADKEPGDDVKLVTYYHVSEKQPRPTLIGFNREFERDFFEEFLSVAGIGPARAARALAYSVSTIADAIERADRQLLARLEGIGPRTADKIIATLRGRVGKYALAQDEHIAASAPQPTQSEVEHEALAILVQLGHKRPEALKMTRAVLADHPEVTDSLELIQLIYQR